MPGGAGACAVIEAMRAARIARVRQAIRDRIEPAGRLGGRCRGQLRQRKVRTPKGSVPDNIRDLSFKAQGRRVPQKTNRPHLAGDQGKGEKVR
jgi:hypothetical protein